MPASFEHVRTLVVKIGTTLLSGPNGFEGQLMENLVKDLCHVKREQAVRLLIVTSGAMGCGMDILKLDKRPDELPMRQATAAVGQSRLMHYYEALFQTYGDGLHAAQILLSAADLDDRDSYENVRNTLDALFDLGNVIPIVNENDSTATEELTFGDNDTLAARVASKIDADLLIILSNVDGLYREDPNGQSGAQLITEVEALTPEIYAYAGDTNNASSIGGMRTKLDAARIACAAGTPMVIANGHRDNVVSAVLRGDGPMTVFGAVG